METPTSLSASKVRHPDVARPFKDGPETQVGGVLGPEFKKALLRTAAACGGIEHEMTPVSERALV